MSAVAELRALAAQIDPCLIGGADAKLLLRAASELETALTERDAAQRFVLEFRGIVTSEMVERALSQWFAINEPWHAGMSNDVVDTCREHMRASLEAANVCESCASVADHWKNKAEAAEARAEELEKALAPLIAAYVALSGKQNDGFWNADAEPIVVTARRALSHTLTEEGKQ